MIVADTDALVDFLRGREPGATAVAAARHEAELATTVVSVTELTQGVRNERHGRAVRALLDELRVLRLGRAAAEAAGAIRRGLWERGRDIGLADAVIAAICLEHGAPLLTGNARHFEPVPDLLVRPLRAASPA
ncbi:MAG: type II toxin-antitoxin system VapC family toxin [Deltaproteobacteria bacterium]|nr:type II toxin-antitoxin system VapC family toxin [Deltaproteobacteria bacterium]